jgi:ABC-type uncharacterized transport system substrate-binding protein
MSGSVVSLAFALCLVATADAAAQTQKPHRIGWLTPAPASFADRREGFMNALTKRAGGPAGSLALEWRQPSGIFDPELDRFPEWAAELADLNVDVIVTTGARATLAAVAATRAIPIVFIEVEDLVATGLVTSPEGRGGNVTGFTSARAALTGKQLALLKRMVPRLSRVAVLYDPREPGAMALLDRTRTAAAGLGLTLQPLEVRSSRDFDGVFAAAKQGGAQAVHVQWFDWLVFHLHNLPRLAQLHRLPLTSTSSNLTEAGGLMSHQADTEDLIARAAGVVDRILRGTKPGEVPVGQPAIYRLVINLKTAQALGLTVPPSLPSWAELID